MATRKTKRYDEGGVTNDDLEAANATEDPIETLNKRKSWTDTGEEAAPKKMSFKEAFAAARKAGDKTFQFEGKKFTTELAGEKKPAKVTDTGDETSRLSARMPKPELKYQSLADRARGYEAEREKSGVGMYGSTKREKAPVEDRMLKDARIRKSEQTGMGAMKFSKGGSTASRRGDGIAQRGKTRGRIV
jgi:hypothetical protein